MGHLTKFDQSQSIGFYKHTLCPTLDGPKWKTYEYKVCYTHQVLHLV